MKVQLFSSSNILENQIELLKAIREYIIASGYTIPHDWIEPYIRSSKNFDRSFSNEEWRIIADKSNQATKEADIIIIEISDKTFSSGFQAARAVQFNKPLLLIANDKARFRNIVIENSGTVSLKSYRDKKDVIKIINKFIKDMTIDTKKLRFNMFLDRASNAYLISESRLQGKTKAEIIRELILSKINIDRQL